MIDDVPENSGLGDTTALTNATGSIDLNNMITAGENISVSGSTVTISSGGTYYITGENAQANIVVRANDTDDVVIILNGVKLTNATGSVIYVESGKSLRVETTAGSTNILSDGATYTENTSGSATIYSTSNTEFGGEGTLIVYGNYKNGIYSKETLTVNSGTIYVHAVNNGITGAKAVNLNDGTMYIKSGNDGIKSNSTIDGEGIITISNGTYYIHATGDGIQAEHTLTINDGTINIAMANEGLEANQITINGGTIEIRSVDDAINASGEYQTPRFTMTGGVVTFLAGGDGIDSNGDITISGGDINAMVQSTRDNEPIDLDGTLIITGGNLALGGTNNAGISNAVNEDAPSYILIGKVTQGDKVVITDSEGNIVGEYTAVQTVDNLVYSNMSITADVTYSVSINGGSSESILSGEGADASMEAGGGPGFPGEGGFPGESGTEYPSQETTESTDETSSQEETNTSESELNEVDNENTEGISYATEEGDAKTTILVGSSVVTLPSAAENTKQDSAVVVQSSVLGSLPQTGETAKSTFQNIGLVLLTLISGTSLTGYRKKEKINLTKKN